MQSGAERHFSSSTQFVKDWNTALLPLLRCYLRIDCPSYPQAEERSLAVLSRHTAMAAWEKAVFNQLHDSISTEPLNTIH